MSFAAVVLAAEKGHELAMNPWLYGTIALIVFAALALVTWTFRDVQNRHSHKAAPDAASHAGAPGATRHGSGHPGAEHHDQ